MNIRTKWTIAKNKKEEKNPFATITGKGTQGKKKVNSKRKELDITFYPVSNFLLQNGNYTDTYTSK